MEIGTREEKLLAAFNGEDHDTVSDQVRNLPYQLLTVTAGTPQEAELRHSTKAILVIHEFRTPKTDDEKMEQNASQLIRFLRLLLQQNGAADENFQLRCGQLIGPLPLPVEEVHQISLFVGSLEPTGWGDKDEIAPRKTAQYGL